MISFHLNRSSKIILKAGNSVARNIVYDTLHYASVLCLNILKDELISLCKEFSLHLISCNIFINNFGCTPEERGKLKTTCDERKE